MTDTAQNYEYRVPVATVDSIKKSIVYKLIFTLGLDPKEARPHHWINAAMFAARDLATENWIATRHDYIEGQKRIVYYLSMEFLVGRAFVNSLINENLYDLFRQAFEELGVDFESAINEEEDPGLGNGGLGRLAACFMDSLSTLRIHAVGYGIRYQYGMFHQDIERGQQVEKPDLWLEKDMAWQFFRPSKRFPVYFGGSLQRNAYGVHWYPAEKIIAVAYDDLVPGFKHKTTNTLRLWSARAGDDFNLNAFNRGDYFAAMGEQNNTENISRVLYPDDSTMAGRELRLRQEYFLTSASMQDILQRHKKICGANISNLAEKVAIHLNDTHPVLAIPELMRLLMHQEFLNWDKAWEICQKVFSYTNHTLMSEALETWPVDLMQRLLPQHLDIIYRINAQFLDEVRERFPDIDDETIRRISIIDESGNRRIRMAWLAVIASHKVNGVAKIHSELMKTSIFADFARLFPEKFTNVTNGVTPRRWLMIANPGLSDLISKTLKSDDWCLNLEKLKDLNKFADEEEFLRKLAKVKTQNKRKLADYIAHKLGISVDPNALFDVQIKRIHEYKRQSLNVLHIVDRYLRICANPDADWQPRVFIFAGKAASAYYMAKKIIRMIHDVAQVINNDARIRNLIKVVFIPNYSVSLAQLIIPAADLSEQISLAGTEASGTSNMKFALNGALTIGTLDGANVEILERVGKENIFIFGNTVEEVENLRQHGYDPLDFVEKDHTLRRTVHALTTDVFSPEEPARYADVIQLIGDYYQLMADFRSYVDTQGKVDAHYRQPIKWQKSALLNIANMGYFSSDRSIKDYAENIWHTIPSKF
ncbi:MAG: glycogen/starch/alpha-glucan phosphorylase [Cardiobacteriaceae bacterium]|nr:glycogen/starch/alpha-glucan phosphorylase [Cardiobacteriaceae bacterium]